jgi:hypothetical protein
MWFTPPSMHLCKAIALCAPVMIMTTSRACSMSDTAGPYLGRCTYIEHCLNANSKGHFGHLVQIVPKKPRVGDYGVVSKGLYTCPRFKAGTWFIEGDVPVGSNTAQEQLNTTGPQNLLLVLVALCLEIRRVAIEYVDVVGLYVDMGEEVLVHEAVVAFRVVPRDPNILVLIGSACPTATMLCYTPSKGTASV